MSAIELRIDLPHSARVCDVLLGGWAHFTADRELAWRIQRAFPYAGIAAIENRGFLARAVCHLASLGLTQFLDLGAGIPHEVNLHEHARQIQPGARVVYLDHDPIVALHLEALLDDPAAGIGVLRHDLEDPAGLFAALSGQGVLDVSRPIVFVAGGLLDHLGESAAHGLLAELTAKAAAVSALVVSHAGADLAPQAMQEMARVFQEAGIGFHPRTRGQVEAFFDGWALIPPGLTITALWRSDGRTEPETTAPVYAGVAIRTPLP